MSESQLATVSATPRASDQLASFLGIEKGMMLDTLKAQCFKGKRPDEVSDAQLAAFVSTANALQVNPLLPGFLYAYPERNGGITPILGPDGVMKKLDEFIASGKLTGYDCDVKMGADGKPESATAIIYRGGDNKPAKYTAYFSEWAVTSNPNWQARPRHMLWVRAIKQCARQVIHGLPMDADEYEISQMANVTPEPVAPPAPRPEPPKRQKRGAAAVVEAETVPTVPEAPKPVEAAPVPVAPEPVKDVAAEKAEALKEPAQTGDPEPKGAAKVVAPATTGRAFLKEGEELTLECKILAVEGRWLTRDGVRNPGIYAKVSGGFNGEVWSLAGGIADGEDVRLPELWKVGGSVVLTLRGELNKKEPGRTRAFVQKIEAVMEEF